MTMVSAECEHLQLSVQQQTNKHLDNGVGDFSVKPLGKSKMVDSTAGRWCMWIWARPA